MRKIFIKNIPLEKIDRIIENLELYGYKFDDELLNIGAVKSMAQYFNTNLFVYFLEGHNYSRNTLTIGYEGKEIIESNFYTTLNENQIEINCEMVYSGLKSPETLKSFDYVIYSLNYERELKDVLKKCQLINFKENIFINSMLNRVIINNDKISFIKFNVWTLDSDIRDADSNGGIKISAIEFIEKFKNYKIY